MPRAVANLIRTPLHRRYEMAVMVRKVGSRRSLATLHRLGTPAILADHEQAEFELAERMLAVDVAEYLGHEPRRHGNDVTCQRCGRAGVAGDTLTGEMYNTRCGIVEEP